MGNEKIDRMFKDCQSWIESSKDRLAIFQSNLGEDNPYYYLETSDGMFAAAARLRIATVVLNKIKTDQPLAQIEKFVSLCALGGYSDSTEQTANLMRHWIRRVAAEFYRDHFGNV